MLLYLVQGLIFADANAIKENSAKLGAGEDLYALFAGILTMRPWNRVIDPAADHLIIQGSESDRSELQVSSCNGWYPEMRISLRIELYAVSSPNPVNNSSALSLA